MLKGVKIYPKSQGSSKLACSDFGAEHVGLGFTQGMPTTCESS